MVKRSSVVHIDGSQYDAHTGQLVGTVKKTPRQSNNSLSGVIDGFKRPSSPNLSAHSANSRKTIDSSPITEPTTSSSPSRTARNVHQRAQHSQTLMRSGLSRPRGDSPEKIAASQRRLHKSRAATLSPVKVSRATAVLRSNKVQRFGFSSAPERNHGVKSPPIQVSASPRATALTSQPAGASMAVATRPLPSMVTSVSHQQLERLLDEALTKADAHKKALQAKVVSRNPWHRIKRMPRWLSISSVLLVVILVAGFFAWQNVPQVAMRIAAARANVKALMPGYTPSDFSFAAPIDYSKGAVTVEYRAKNDSSRTFSLTQQSSNWDSQSLVANTIPKGSQMQTAQVNGTTVYIYGPSNHATWVNNGIRYTITDKASLQSDQILKIAGSL